jgi:microcystin degradation protein MlrC
MRIAIGGILHETATFIERPTRLSDFEAGFGLFRGPAMIERFRGANMCPGGFLAAAEECGYDIVPLLWGFAYPSGMVDRQDYETLKAELLARLRDAETSGGPIDGVLLDLHGSMVVEGIDDADGDVIAAVRGVVGRERPIIVTTDLHSNHTPRRVAEADAIIGYDTYPHVDMAERGREAGRLMVRTLRGEVRPQTGLRQLPMFWSTRTQVTAHPPMDEVMRRVHELESRPGLLSVTVATSFPWADVPDVGAAVIAVADGDRELAQRTADELGDWLWEQRERWYAPPLAVRDALTAGQLADRYPIFLADHADNTGGGSPGDSTEILQTFLELGLPDALLLYLVDPAVARQAHAAGVGAKMKVSLGGKSSPVQGPPVIGEAEVLALSEGRFAYDGPMYAGLTGDMGTSAAIRIGGVTVVVVTSREQPLDPGFARTLGIDCTRMKYVCVKSAAHFRSGFERLAGAIYNVDARAILTHDWSTLQYHKRTRPVFPIEIPPRPAR